MGQQEVHEYEAFRDGYGRCRYCRLTAFSTSLQTIFVHNSGPVDKIKKSAEIHMDAGRISKVGNRKK